MIKNKPVILVIDQKNANFTFIREVLAGEDYDLHFLDSRQANLGKIQQYWPTVILLGRAKSGSNVFSTCRQLKHLPEMGEVAVIITVEAGGSDIQIESYDAGADDVWIFPIHPLELKTRLRNILRLNHYKKLLDERQHAEKLQHALFRISEAAHAAHNLGDLYAEIHQIVSSLMPARNLYIARIFEKEAQIRFPYYVDEKDVVLSSESFAFDRDSRSLTRYMVNNGNPLLITRPVFDDLARRGVISTVGTTPEEWLGAPLRMVSGEIIGAIVVQSYSPDIHYNQQHIQILNFVSSQIATVISRKEVEEALRASETRFRVLLEHAPDAMLIQDEQDRILEANPAYCELLSYTREELLQMHVQDVVAPDLRQPLGEQIKNELTRRVFEGVDIDKFGRRIPVEVRTSCLDDMGEGVLTVSIVRDITQRKQREREMQAITSLSFALRQALNHVQMPPIILQEVFKYLANGGAALATYSAGNVPKVEAVIGAWDDALTEQILAVPRHVLQEQLSSVVDDPLSVVFQIPTDEIEVNKAIISLVVNQRLIGELWIYSPGMLDMTDWRVLTSLANIAANALHRSDLHEQTERRLERLMALRKIDSAITTNFNLGETLNVLLDQIAEQLGIDAGIVLLLDPQSKELVCSASHGLINQTIMECTVKLGEGLAGVAAASRELVNVPDIRVPGLHFPRLQMLLDEGFISYFGAPLISKDTVLGVLSVYTRRPFAPDKEWFDFLSTLAGQAAIAIDNARMFENMLKSRSELEVAYDDTILGWSMALELRDMETKGHSLRVTELTVELARMVGIDEVILPHIRRGALLHDIGKMGIPDSILLKPGPLNDVEWAVMRRHPQLAFDMLYSIEFLRPALEIPYYHHERWNGKGYPHGLKGGDIPLVARIFAIIDVWDALCSDRPYRPALSRAEVVEYIKSNSGIQFDPDIVEAFLALLEQRGLYRSKTE
jgi:PAS domain S-box-containing protein